MQSAYDMYLEHSTIQEGFLKGARITLSDEDIVQLMEEYHQQFEEQRKEQFKEEAMNMPQDDEIQRITDEFYKDKSDQSQIGFSTDEI